MASKQASAMVYLMEELGDARMRCDQLLRYLVQGTKIIEKSTAKDHIYEVAGGLLEAIPETAFKLDKALQAVALAANRIDYEEVKQELRPEKVEELERVLQDVRIRSLSRRSDPLENPMTTHTAAALTIQELRKINRDLEDIVLDVKAVERDAGDESLKGLKAIKQKALETIKSLKLASGKTAAKDETIIDPVQVRKDLEEVVELAKAEAKKATPLVQASLEDIIQIAEKSLRMVKTATAVSPLVEAQRVLAGYEASLAALGAEDTKRVALEAVVANQRALVATLAGDEAKLSRFEEGKPADPTENMSPEDAAEWKKNTEEHKDQFKAAGLAKAPWEMGSKGKPMRKYNDEGGAAEYAKEEGLSYGFSTFSRGWFCGTPEQLKGIGVTKPVTPSGKTAGFSADPHWITAKYPGKAEDGTPFKKGDRVLYWPKEKKFQVGPKAEAAMKRFEAEVADEAFYNYRAARFEEGKPADPTENMSPEDAKKWEAMNEEHGDNFKAASTTKLGFSNQLSWENRLEAVTHEFVSQTAEKLYDYISTLHKRLSSRAPFDKIPGFLSWDYGAPKEDPRGYAIRVYQKSPGGGYPEDLDPNLVITLDPSPTDVRVSLVVGRARTLVNTKVSSNKSAAAIGMMLGEAWEEFLTGNVEYEAGVFKHAAAVLWKYTDEDGKDFYLAEKKVGTVRSPYTGKTFTAKPAKTSMGGVGKELKEDDAKVTNALWKYTDKDGGEFWLPERITGTVKSPLTGKGFTAKPVKEGLGGVAKELREESKKASLDLFALTQGEGEQAGQDKQAGYTDESDLKDIIQGLKKDTQDLEKYQEYVRTLQQGGTVGHLTLPNAMQSVKSLQQVIRNKEDLIKRLSRNASAEGQDPQEGQDKSASLDLFAQVQGGEQEGQDKQAASLTWKPTLEGRQSAKVTAPEGTYVFDLQEIEGPGTTLYRLTVLTPAKLVLKFKRQLPDVRKMKEVASAYAKTLQAEAGGVDFSREWTKLASEQDQAPAEQQGQDKQALDLFALTQV